MFEEMFSIAKNKLVNINECVKQLPAPQVIVLLTENNTIYVAENDVDGLICEKLKSDNNTKVVKMLTMWKNGQIDLPSIKFRKALVLLNENNNDTEILLQGKDDFIIKKLSSTLR